MRVLVALIGVSVCLVACENVGRVGGGADGGLDFAAADGGQDAGVSTGDPITCDDAAVIRSYLGCDFWPTAVANPVWSVFDFAAVVANPGTTAVDVMVTGPSGFSKSTSIGPGALEKIYLPWVPALKGGDFDSCGASVPFTGSVLSQGGAYHLVSSRPVSVYQFSALEYKGSGGAAGKNWNTCPGLQTCLSNDGMPIGCFSFSNDASLLLPTTALTGNYRVTGVRSNSFSGAYFAITATENGTQVTIKVSELGTILSGGGLAATTSGGTTTASLAAGDVLQVMGSTGPGTDLSGSLVIATKPVQVISGVPCTNNPDDMPACDHLEESVSPAETFGQHYIVTAPTGPNGAVAPFTVRFYGNVDGTKLTYDPAIVGAPTTLSAGDVIDIDTLTYNFEVTGNNSFAIGTVQQGASVVDPTSPGLMQKGDPSLSMATAVEQYRQSYIFLAPDDYDINYVDIVAPVGATLTLDGAAITTSPTLIGGGGFGVFRKKLGAGMSGAHTLVASAPVGIQVLGYGSYTSYQYPGGLNLNSIAPPPIP